MTRRLTLGLAALLASAVPVPAQEVDALLGGLGRPAAIEKGSVVTLAWVERVEDGFELVVALEPRDGARLVADPGITVQPLADPNVTWGQAMVTAVDEGADYFAAQPILRLPFRGTAETVGARVDYAWCVVTSLCLFGEAEVTARVPHEG